MVDFFNANNGQPSKIVVNGQTIITTGGPVTVSTVNGVTTVTTGEAVKPVEPFTEDVAEGTTKRLSGMGQKVDCDVIDGTLVVEGMNADVEVHTLNGNLRVTGMGADVLVDFVRGDSSLTVDGMNSIVRINDAVIGALVNVSGMGSRLDAPATIVTTCDVSGMNSKMKFH